VRTSRAITWARLRVYFGTLLLILFALGGALIYASNLADRQRGLGRSELRTLGAELIALSIAAAVSVAVLKRRLSRDE
jgi:peptidoglycan/LPS O-acetylase OafA/YrhL